MFQSRKAFKKPYGTIFSVCVNYCVSYQWSWSRSRAKVAAPAAKPCYYVLNAKLRVPVLFHTCALVLAHGLRINVGRGSTVVIPVHCTVANARTLIWLMPNYDIPIYVPLFKKMRDIMVFWFLVSRAVGVRFQFLKRSLDSSVHYLFNVVLEIVLLQKLAKI